MPSNYKSNMKIGPQAGGPNRRQELFDEIREKRTYLPSGVLHEDMDNEFVEFVKNDLKVVIDGEEVPVIFLTIQRWSDNYH